MMMIVMWQVMMAGDKYIIMMMIVMWQVMMAGDKYIGNYDDDCDVAGDDGW